MIGSPAEFFQFEKQRIMQQLYPQEGGTAYGGDFAGRERDRMRSGGADLTFGNVMSGLGNAFNVVTGATSPMGLASLGMQATGLDQKTVFGEKLGSLFGGGLTTKFEGGFAYDRDLMDAVGSGKMTRATADRIQRERNAVKERDKLAKGLTAPGRSMANRGGFGPRGGGGGFGRGPSGGSVRGGIGAQGGAGVAGGYGGGPGGTGRGPK